MVAVPNASPIRVLRVITRLNIGGPAIHAILLTHALDDGVTFKSTLVTGMRISANCAVTLRAALNGSTISPP